MNILIKQAKIVDPGSPFNGQVADILIKNGIITSIGKKISAKVQKTIDVSELHVSPGWIDIFSDFADPGFEFRETLETGAASAMAGGFTDVCIIPNTKPAIDQKSVVEYIMQKSSRLAVNIHPLGAISKNTEGKELSEMYDMKENGAIAFTDGVKAVQSPDLLLKALLYIKTFDGVIIQVPDHKSITPNGLVNEGITSTRMGLPGKASIGEELMVARDIKLAAYTGSRLHITGITTAATAQQIKDAKKQGLKVTASVTPYHLFFTEEDLHNYDTNLKVNPPLRTVKDRKALQKAVADGTIDCIASHHSPHDTDEKIIEFEYAKYGMIGLQTLYGVLNTALPQVPQQRWIELLAINPRKILSLTVPVIAEGEKAKLTLFNPNEKWTVDKTTLLSQSKNSAFISKELKGRPYAIINNNQTNL